MVDMWVDAAPAAPAFATTGEAKPVTAGGTGAGADPLTAAVSAALGAMSTELLGADAIASGDEASAGSTGTSNVQNFTQAEETHTAELRPPDLQGDTSGTTWV